MQILHSADRQRMPENFDGAYPATHLRYCDASQEVIGSMQGGRVNLTNAGQEPIILVRRSQMICR